MKHAAFNEQIVNNVVSITSGRRPEIIPQAELQDIGVSERALEEGWQALLEARESIRARLRKGAKIEEGPYEFDEITGSVKRKKSGCSC